MDIFFLLFINLLPLYLIIGAGYLAGRFYNIDRETLANLIIYICVPVVIFGFVASLDLKPAYALLPMVIFTVSAIIGLSFLKIGQHMFGDNRANLVALCASMGNTGYFGLPLVLFLFDKQWTGVYMFMMLGGTLYEGTIGYYIAARGRFTVRDSLIKLAKFPSLYAVAAGLTVNLSGVHLPDLFFTYWAYFKGAYVVIGMMIIGAALAKVDRLVFGPRFIMLSFIGKFALWPLLLLSFIFMDIKFFHLLEPQVYRLLFVFSLVPPAANVAAYASQMDMRAEKAATTVLMGTIFALFYIPLVLAIMGL